MPETFTLAEAAAMLGVREDTLVATLPEIGFDVPPQSLTEEEVEKLKLVFQKIKVLHTEAG